MATTAPSAKVSDIQLVEFTYNSDYDFDSLTEVDIRLKIMHRAPLDEDQYHFMIRIDYFDKVKSEPILNASCVTIYDLIGMDKMPDPDGGGSLINLPDDIEEVMAVEAIAHARALVGLQASSTPLGKTYVSLGTGLIRKLINNAVEEAVKTKA